MVDVMVSRRSQAVSTSFHVFLLHTLGHFCFERWGASPFRRFQVLNGENMMSKEEIEQAFVNAGW